MSALTEVAKQAFDGRRSDISTRLEGLSQAVDAADGCLDPALLDAARELESRAIERLQLSGDHTIVALGGATGSGKSSLFNRLTDLDIAGVGVRRPTTSWALACAWGPDGAGDLLEWMGIPPRHQVSRMSMLDRSSAETKLDGMILLDLPDHDSTEVSHHLEMERLMEYADLMVWVLDPQKYADAAIHDRYIKPMAEYSDVMLVVLNQIDRIAPEDRERALADVKAILTREGLPDVPVMGVSATSSDGLDGLRRELVRRIAAKQSAKERLGSDLSLVAGQIAETGGTSEVAGLDEDDRQGLELGLLDGVGVPQLADAVESATKRRGDKLTGWPVAQWLVGRRRKAAEGADLPEDLTALARRADPTFATVHRPYTEAAIRDMADRASVGLKAPWRNAISARTVERSEAIIASLNEAVGSSDVELAPTPFWWRIVNVLQWLMLAAFAVGLVWSALVLIAQVSPINMPSGPKIGGIVLPIALLFGGLIGGIVLALVSRVVVRFDARKAGRRIEDSLRAVVGEVAQAQVLTPVNDVLGRYETYRKGIVSAVH